MLSKIGSAFSEKESLVASETLNDGDDLFISPSFQPGEENSSVMGNSSYVGHIEAPPMPFEDDKNIYAEPTDSTVTSKSTDSSIDTQPILARTNPSFSQSMTRTIPKRDQLSKFKEDMPWAIYGNDHVSRLANDTLDAGDDIHISPSCEQDDFSTIGNSSVAPFDTQSTAREMEGEFHTPTSSFHTIKSKKGLFRKLSLTKKITRMLPSKQYVSKLSKLTEDVPWSMNAQEQISKEADEMLNDGDDLFITESFEPLETDTSSVLGNSSYVSSATKSTFGPGGTTNENRDDISTHEALVKETRKNINESKAGTTGTLRTPVTEKLKNAIPAPITETLKSAIPVAEKLKSAIPTPVTQKLKGVPGNVVSSSQKLMARRLKSMVSSQIRTGPLSDYQEFGNDTRDSSKDFLLSSNYHTKTSEGDFKRRPRIRPVQVSSRELMTNSESSRNRSVSWDDTSCSDMSDITEPSMHSRSRSFRKTHSMFIIPAGESLLGSADEDSEAGMSGNGSTASNSNFLGSRLKQQAGDHSMTNLPNINESKPFNAMSSTEIFSPNVVNGFLNRMESNDKPVKKKSEGTWDTISIFSSENWQHTTLSDVNDSANRERVFSDSDAVYEFQRQRSAQDISENPSPQMTGTLKGLSDNDSLTLFVDSVDSSDESETKALSRFETHQQIPSFEAHFHDPMRRRDENDHWRWKTAIIDDENASWSQRPHLLSNPKTINDDGGEEDLNVVDAADAFWKPRHRFMSESNAASNSSEHRIDVDDDCGWSPRPRFASDSEAINNHGVANISPKSTQDAVAAGATWSQQTRFALDAVTDGTNSSWSYEPFESDPVNRATANVPSGSSLGVDVVESSLELSSDSRATDDEPETKNTSTGERHGTWSQHALFDQHSAVTSGGITGFSSTEDFIAVIDVDEQDSHVDDKPVTKKISNGEKDSTWSRHVLFDQYSEGTSEGITKFSSTEDFITVIDVDEQDSHTDDKPSTKNIFNDERDGTWSRHALFDQDSEIASEGIVEFSSTEDFVAVIDVEEQNSHSESPFKSNSIIVNDNDSPEHNDGSDPSWTQRPRFLSDPAASHAGVAMNMILTEKTIDAVDTSTDVSWNPRSRFFSDPIGINEQVPNCTTVAESNPSTIDRRRFSFNTAGSKEDDGPETTGDIDHHDSSSGDEKPLFSSASFTINDNDANSEIEISLHGGASLSPWTSEETLPRKMMEAEAVPEEHQTEKGSPETTAYDYYWNQSSDSEEDSEDNLFSQHQNDSFADIL